MTRFVSPLLFAIALSAPLTGSLWSADQTTQRAVRSEEGRQRSINSQTIATGQEVVGLIDEYRYNGIGDENKLKILDKLQTALNELSDPNATSDQPNMPWVTKRLSNARQLQNLVALRGELIEAAEGQGTIVAELDKLLKELQDKFGKQLKTDLTQVIQEQKRLKETTEQLAEKTLGQKAEELNKEQQKDLEKTAEQQNQLEQQVQEAVQALKEQAKEQQSSDPEQAKQIEQALEKLTDAAVQDAIQQAAQDIAENQLAQAQEAQQQVLDALEKAQEQLASQSPEQSPSIAQLEQQIAQVESIQQQQQQLKNQTEALDQSSSPQEFNQLQTQQAQLQAQLAQLQPPPSLESTAKEALEAQGEAAQELGEQDQAEAAGAQEEALAALEKLQQGLEQQLAEATGAPKPPMPGQPGQPQPTDQPPQLVVQNQSQVPDPKEPQELGSDLQNGEKNNEHGSAAWQVDLPPKERETLSAAQKDKFPSRYEKQLKLYYQNLATGK